MELGKLYDSGAERTFTFDCEQRDHRKTNKSLVDFFRAITSGKEYEHRMSVRCIIMVGTGSTQNSKHIYNEKKKLKTKITKHINESTHT